MTEQNESPRAGARSGADGRPRPRPGRGRLGSAARWALAAALLLPVAAPGGELVVVDYNAWHGTYRGPGVGFLRQPGETRPERSRRWELQDRLLAEQDPGVLFLQEVNPLPRRARRLGRRLGLAEVHRTTDCGLKLFGLGVPVNVRSGLAILARPGLGLRRLARVRLSGRYAFCSDLLGLQLREGRSALFAVATLPDGRSLLLVATHLHNAPGLPERLAAGIGTLRAAGRLTDDQVEAIFRRVEQGRRRQLDEAERLVAAIGDLRRRHAALDGVLVGGDLNAASGSPVLERLAAAGLVGAAEALGVEPGPTSDAAGSALRRALAERSRPSIPTFGVAELEALELETRLAAASRIDHLLLSRELVDAVRSVEVFGRPGGDGEADDPAPPSALPLESSDHFGLTVRLVW